MKDKRKGKSEVAQVFMTSTGNQFDKDTEQKPMLTPFVYKERSVNWFTLFLLLVSFVAIYASAQYKGWLPKEMPKIPLVPDETGELPGDQQQHVDSNKKENQDDMAWPYILGGVVVFGGFLYFSGLATKIQDFIRGEEGEGKGGTGSGSGGPRPDDVPPPPVRPGLAGLGDRASRMAGNLFRLVQRGERETSRLSIPAIEDDVGEIDEVTHPEEARFFRLHPVAVDYLRRLARDRMVLNITSQGGETTGEGPVLLLENAEADYGRILKTINAEGQTINAEGQSATRIPRMLQGVMKRGRKRKLSQIKVSSSQTKELAKKFKAEADMVGDETYDQFERRMGQYGVRGTTGVRRNINKMMEERSLEKILALMTNMSLHNGSISFQEREAVNKQIDEYIRKYRPNLQSREAFYRWFNNEFRFDSDDDNQNERLRIFLSL